MSYESEFLTVKLVVESDAPTKGVDAFSLSLIKCERQIRKIFTYLIYQFPCFSSSDIAALRRVLCEYRSVYFVGFEQGINMLLPNSIPEWIPNYTAVRYELSEAIDIRNKVFHGQLTNRFLNQEELLAYVATIQAWCKNLADRASISIGYDGFGRQSFRKHQDERFYERLGINLTDINEYDSFIKNYMIRR